MHLDGGGGTRDDACVDVLRAGGGDGLHAPVDGEGSRRRHAFKRASSLAGHGHGALPVFIAVGNIERSLYGRSSARTERPACIVLIVSDHEARRGEFAELAELVRNLQHFYGAERLFGIEEHIGISVHELAPLLIVTSRASSKPICVPNKACRKLARVVKRCRIRALAAGAIADTQVNAIVAIFLGLEGAYLSYIVR